MEPEVHIIERYYQEIYNCFTMTNVRVNGNKEIDLLAMSLSPRGEMRYHVESRIATTFKLKEKATYTKDGRCHKDGLDYFNKEKFEHPHVKAFINEVFGTKPYQKVLVIWDIQRGRGSRRYAYAQVLRTAQSYGIMLLSMKTIIDDLIERSNASGSRDDILRTMELVSLIRKEEMLRRRRIRRRDIRAENRQAIRLRMKCPSCDCWNRFVVEKVFLKQWSSELKANEFVTLYFSFTSQECFKCGHVLAKEKELIKTSPQNVTEGIDRKTGLECSS